MSQERAKITLTLDEAMRRDLLLFNNPVLIQGLALTPVIAAATTLKNAVVLALVAFILIVPTRIVGDLLIGYVPKNLRALLYSIVSALLYIPALLLVVFLFKADAAGPGGYLPLLIVDGIVLSRTEIQAREGTAKAIRNGIFTAFGAGVVLVIVGLLREFLTSGTIWGVPLLPKAIAAVQAGASIPTVFPIAGTVAGGFILVALLSAFLQWAGASYKRANAGVKKSND